jgi:hypothetical protein
MKSFVAFETGYNGARPCVTWSPRSGLDSLPSSEPFMIASMSIDSRFFCILRFRRGAVDRLLDTSRPGSPNEVGGFFMPSDGFLVTCRPRPWDIPEADTDRVRISDGLATELDCAARDDTTASFGSSSSVMGSTGESDGFLATWDCWPGEREWRPSASAVESAREWSSGELFPVRRGLESSCRCCFAVYGNVGVLMRDR